MRGPKNIPTTKAQGVTIGWDDPSIYAKRYFMERGQIN